MEIRSVVFLSLLKLLKMPVPPIFFTIKYCTKHSSASGLRRRICNCFFKHFVMKQMFLHRSSFLLAPMDGKLLDAVTETRHLSSSSCSRSDDARELLSSPPPSGIISDDVKLEAIPGEKEDQTSIRVLPSSKNNNREDLEFGFLQSQIVPDGRSVDKSEKMRAVHGDNRQ